MGERSAISWTDHTFQPWEGCSRVSPGCVNCYAEARDDRFHNGAHWGKAAPRKMMSDAYWRQPLKWDRAAAAAGRRDRVFCASLADVFEDRPDLEEPRRDLWGLIERTPHLDWLLLTKRPEHMRVMLPWAWGYPRRAFRGGVAGDEGRWNPDPNAPWPNVWLGTSVEDQQRADERMPLLLDIPAVVRFVSCEPLLGPVDLGSADNRHWHGFGVDWVICGGESGGRHARPMHPDWSRSLRDQCQAAGVAFHFKQWGSWGEGEMPHLEYQTVLPGLASGPPWAMHYAGVSGHSAGRKLDGRTWDEVPEVVS